MIEYKDGKGFPCYNDIITRKNLKIGIIDADLLDHGTRHPNLALLKISSFCKRYGHNVNLICSYNEIIPTDHDTNTNAIAIGYDLLIMSMVFTFTEPGLPEQIKSMIKEGKIVYGGTGFFTDKLPNPDKKRPIKEEDNTNLPYDVEHSMPDYHLYDRFIELQPGDEESKNKRYKDYKYYSIGFTTRGCIRQCGFCVNKLCHGVDSWSPVKEFLNESRPYIYLWDDNIMVAPHRLFKKVMEDLIKTNKPFQFRQGMDIRLMTDKKAELLAHVKYHGDFIFAFDHYRLDDPHEAKQVKDTIRGLEVWRRHCKKTTKLYVIVAYDSQDEKDIEGTFFRIKTLMEFGCLPYIMRFEKYKGSEFENMYVQLARWCNQPSFIKKMSFRQYCVRNEEFHQGIQYEHPKGTYYSKLILPNGFKPKKNFCKCYQTMIDFEESFPDLAKKYFDIRFEDLNRYK